MPDETPVPVAARVHLAHAVLQAVADGAGVDVLHIKGPAIDPVLRGERARDADPAPATLTPRLSSVDADVMVRPSDLPRYMDALRAHGWTQVTAFLDEGLVQHSTAWFHPQLGQADVHYRFPGIGLAPEPAFDELWRDHRSADIAHQPCTVPSVTAQRLILLLHAARDPVAKSGDVQRAWHTATPPTQDEIRALAVELRADVALAAATGHLEDFRDRPEYDLWKLYSEGHSASGGFTKLLALSRAAPDGYRHVRLRVARHALRAVVHAPARLAASLPRRPTAREVAHAYRRLLRRALDVFRLGER